MRRVIAILLLIISSDFAAAHPVPLPKLFADLVIVNAHIWTVDRERPEVEALAAWQGRVLAVGSTTEVRSLIGPKTVIIDARGRRVLPGFHDSHLHLLGSGLRLKQVSLKDAKNADEFGKRLTEFDRTLPKDRWLTGGDWDHERTFAGNLPTAADLDRFVPERPALLRRYDGHMALANSRALQQAAIGSQTPDPPGGEIVRDPVTKLPNGLLRDRAIALVDALIPLPDEAEIIDAVRAALVEMRQAGVTSAVDMEGSAAPTRRTLVSVYQQMAKAGDLTSRIEVRWPLADWKELCQIAVQRNFGNDFLRVGGVKGFMDGSLGSHTAKMFEPYQDAANSTGLFVTPREKIRELVAGADAAGLSIAVHAIGDQANAELLNIYEDVQKQNGGRDHRLRIEHAQHLRPADIARFSALGVVASMQPYHVSDDGRWAETRIGPSRCATSYAFRSLLDSGAKVAFGTDWSVAPISPVLGIDAAVNRRTLDGKHPNGWFPEQRITVAEAIEAYTLTSAFASHQESERGSIVPGKYADFVLLSDDILSPTVRDSIANIRVLATVTGGKIVFDARPAGER